MTPTVIQRLREALGNERMQCIGMQPFEFYQQAQGLTYDAIAAIEQELAAKDAEIAELRRKCPDCGSPMPGEMCAVCALAIAEAEIAELRKDKERLDWIEANPSGVLNIRDNGWHTRSDSFGAEWSVMLPTLRDAVDATLYAEKARAEAPK